MHNIASRASPSSILFPLPRYTLGMRSIVRSGIMEGTELFRLPAEPIAFSFSACLHQRTPWRKGPPQTLALSSKAIQPCRTTPATSLPDNRWGAEKGRNMVRIHGRRAWAVSLRARRIGISAAIVLGTTLHDRLGSAVSSARPPRNPTGRKRPTKDALMCALVAFSRPPVPPRQRLPSPVRNPPPTFQP